jgi:hypothetical protein
MQVRSIILMSAMVFSIGGIGGVAAAEEEETVYANQLQFRGAYSALQDSRAGEVFTDSAGNLLTGGPFNSDTGGWSAAAILDLSAMTMEGMGGANVMGEIFIEYSKFSDRLVRQAPTALVGLNNFSNVAVTELNVTVAPKLRFDDLGSGRFRPFVIPIGLSFLVNSPPSNDATYLDLGLHFGGGLDVLIIDRVSVGWDARYTYGLEETNTNTRYWSTGAYVALNF